MGLNSEILGTESVHKLILKFGSFSVITMLATGAVSVVGTLIISKGIDIDAVGAVGILFPLITIYFGFSQLVAIGSASYISRMLGKNKKEDAVSAIFVAYILTLGISVVLMVLTWVFKDGVLAFLGADGDYAEFSRTYLSFFIFSIPFTAMTLLASAIFRAYGKLKLSMMVILVDSLLVIGIDYLLVFAFASGIVGVAISNSIASGVSSILGIFLLIRLNKGFSALKKALKWNVSIFTSIASIGISALGRAIATAIFALVLNKIIINLGNEDMLTALGTVNRIIIFLLFTIMGINQAMQPVVSYNYTSGENSRVKKALKYALFYSTIIGLIGTLLGIFFPSQVVGFFTTNTDILDDATLIFRMQLLLYFTVGLQTLSATYFQAVGKAWISFFLSVFKPLLLLIPLVYLLPQLFGDNVFALWWTFAIADAVASVICFFILRRDVKKLDPQVR